MSKVTTIRIEHDGNWYVLKWERKQYMFRSFDEALDWARDEWKKGNLEEAPEGDEELGGVQ